MQIFGSFVRQMEHKKKCGDAKFRTNAQKLEQTFLSMAIYTNTLQTKSVCVEGAGSDVMLYGAKNSGSAAGSILEILCI